MHLLAVGAPLYLDEGGNGWDAFIFRWAKQILGICPCLRCFCCFYGPLMDMLLLSFAGVTRYPDVHPQSYGLKWVGLCALQGWLGQSISTSLVLAVVVTLLSLGRMPARRLRTGTLPVQGAAAPCAWAFFLPTHFPKMGIYAAMAVIFYKLDLIGTFAGVVLVRTS